jgi:hypothetical protein
MKFGKARVSAGGQLVADITPLVRDNLPEGIPVYLEYGRYRN